MLDIVVVPAGAEERAVRRARERTAARVALATTGIGPHSAERAVERILAEGSVAGARVVVLGLCGVLSTRFAVGDALVYREIARAPDGAIVPCDAALSEDVVRAVARSHGGVRAIESDRIVESSAEKIALGRRYAVDAVDMETRVVVERLTANGARVAALRVASDASRDDLPELGRTIDVAGGIDGFAFALALLRRPVAGYHLARNGSRALATLERVAGELLARVASATV